MKILMVGTGYVGLVTAACFAEMGHDVLCLDNNKEKIANIKNNILPFYERGLKELVEKNVAAGRLHFTTDYQEGVQHASVCFIAVPTPSASDGSCDCSYVLSAAAEIAEHMQDYTIIVNKSTVPMGTTKRVHAHIAEVLERRGVDLDFDVVSNPEFLKEGCAVDDCMKPDRIILGTTSQNAIRILRDLYSAFTIQYDRIFVMDAASAELAKYAANAMLALRISFMNELSHLCEKTGANIKDVRIGIGSDQRIGYKFLYAGAGYGGSCFPKDIRALSHIAQHHDVPMPLLNSIEYVNERQKKTLIEKILAFFSAQGGIASKTIAIWGLAFKPDTDDIREAPSLSLIEDLLTHKAHVRAFDPIAMPNARKIFGKHVHFCTDEYEAAMQADAIALVTEWKQFRFVDFSKIVPHLKQKVLFDGRNQYQLAEIEALGMHYFGMGVPSSLILQDALMSVC